MSDTLRRPYGLTTGQLKSGLTKGTTSTYTTTATSAGVINGKYVTGITAQTNTATPTTDAVTAAAFPALSPNKATVLVLGQTAAGTIQMAQGSIEDTEVGITTTVGAFKVYPQFPTLPDDFMVLGYLLVRTAPSAASWIAGTGSWTASGVTASAVAECGTLPDRPQSS